MLSLGVGQILDLVGLCALGCSVAACWLRIVKVRFGYLGGILLTRPTLGLFFAIGCFGRIDTLGSHFVGPLLRGGTSAAVPLRSWAAFRAAVTFRCFVARAWLRPCFARSRLDFSSSAACSRCRVAVASS